MRKKRSERERERGGGRIVEVFRRGSGSGDEAGEEGGTGDERGRKAGGRGG